MPQAIFLNIEYVYILYKVHLCSLKHVQKMHYVVINIWKAILQINTVSYWQLGKQWHRDNHVVLNFVIINTFNFSNLKSNF